MSRDLTSLATRYAGRPLLLTPRAAQELADRVRAVDPRSVTRESRFSALMRKLAGRERDRLAMEDDEAGTPPPDFGEVAAYAPRYVGDVEDEGFCWSLSQGVALMNIDGPLLDRGEMFCGEVYHGYDTILAALREASADERVRGIFVRANTPGGVVADGLRVLSQWMRENGARAGGKPIWIYADMACSAGYWLSASADRVLAPRVGLVGSIGAVIVHESWAGALKEMGVEITPIQFGAKKTDGAWWEKLSASAREDLQAEIDQCGRDFVADVTAGRPGLTEEAVLATEARVFMGHHDDAARSALALGLIDAHAGEEEAFLELAAHVAGDGGRTVSTPATGNPSAAAPRGRASASPAKELVMANKAQAGRKPSAAVAAARKALKQAQAALARAQAAESADVETPAEDEDDEAAATGAAETPADDEDDEDPAPGAETNDVDEDEESNDAQAIAASAEAKSHPGLALAAIQTGQSMAQFRASVAAAGGATGGRNQLVSTLKDSPRLGADGAAPKAGKLDAKSIYASRAARARGRGK